MTFLLTPSLLDNFLHHHPWPFLLHRCSLMGHTCIGIIPPLPPFFSSLCLSIHWAQRRRGSLSSARVCLRLMCPNTTPWSEGSCEIIGGEGEGERGRSSRNQGDEGSRDRVGSWQVRSLPITGRALAQRDPAAGEPSLPPWNLGGLKMTKDRAWKWLVLLRGIHPRGPPLVPFH